MDEWKRGGDISAIVWQMILFGLPVGGAMCLLGFNVLVLAAVPALVGVFLVPGHVLLRKSSPHIAGSHPLRYAFGAIVGGFLGSVAAITFCAAVMASPVGPALVVGVIFGILLGLFNASMM